MIRSRLILHNARVKLSSDDAAGIREHGTIGSSQKM
jgi:hypothetical protein